VGGWKGGRCCQGGYGWVLRRALLSLLETIGVALDGDDLGVVEQPVEEGDDAGGTGARWGRVHLCQTVVVGEVVGADGTVALLQRLGQLQADGRGQVARLAPALQGQAHRVGMVHATGQGLSMAPASSLAP